jgi:hypothetical protein
MDTWQTAEKRERGSQGKKKARRKSAVYLL